MNQVEMVSVDSLVSKNHTYRKLKAVLDFDRLVKSVEIEPSDIGAIGFTIRRLVMCLILQFMENLSDRMFERFMQENNAGKWFCEFGLSEKTPDHTSICKFRNKIGVEVIEKLFEAAKQQMKECGHMAEIFTFIAIPVKNRPDNAEQMKLFRFIQFKERIRIKRNSDIDATALISQLQMWEEKDKAIQDGYEKFNNEVIEKYAKDKEVRIGAKSKNKFWFGFKKFASVDMSSGMIAA
jgi:transposase